MNKSNNDEYSEMVKLFNQLTVEEAELVLIFIRNLRQNRKTDKSERMTDYAILFISKKISCRQ